MAWRWTLDTYLLNRARGREWVWEGWTVSSSSCLWSDYVALYHCSYCLVRSENSQHASQAKDMCAREREKDKERKCVRDDERSTTSPRASVTTRLGYNHVTASSVPAQHAHIRHRHVGSKSHRLSSSCRCNPSLSHSHLYLHVSIIRGHHSQLPATAWKGQLGALTTRLDSTVHRLSGKAVATRLWRFLEDYLHFVFVRERGHAHTHKTLGSIYK